MLLQMTHAIVKFIRIGNSQGVRLPKKLLEARGIELGQEAELIDHPDGLLLKPKTHPRAGWAEQFAKCDCSPDPAFSDFDNDWDNTEWTW